MTIQNSKLNNVKYLIAFIIFFFGIFFFAENSLAANRYIRAEATGANNGTSWTDAWASFSSVAWTRGDTYYVASGLYPENVTISVSGSSWLYIKKATVGEHGTDTGWNDSYASGPAEIRGNCAVTGTNIANPLRILSSFIDVDGVTGSDNSGHGIKIALAGCSDTTWATGGIVILGAGSDSIHLNHMDISGGGFGTYYSTDGLYQVQLATNPAIDIEVKNTWIHDVSRNGITIGGQQGTSFSAGSRGFLFENSHVERTGGCTYPNWHGQGVQIYGGGGTSYVIFRNSKFIDISGTGYIAFLGGSAYDNTRIYNNIFYSTDKAQFTASPGVITVLDSALSSDNLQVYNNTFYNIDLKGVTNWTSSGSGNELKNNIFVNSSFSYGNIGFIFENNDYYNNTYNSSVTWRYFNEPGYQTETADPFVSSAGYDFRLVSTANAVNSGANLGSTFSSDFVDVSRPQGSAWDIGAYEYAGGSPPPDTTPPSPPTNVSVI